MAAKTRSYRWCVLLMASLLLVSACGSNDSPSDDVAEPQVAAANESSSDAESSDAESSDGTSSGDSSSGDNSSASDEPAIEPSSGELDCDRLDEALDSAGALVGGDPSVFDSSPEQQFNQAKATLLELKAQVPEIASEVDQTIAGLEAVAAAFAEIGWDTDFQSDPAAAGKLMRLAFADPDVSAMIASLASIGAWLVSNCVS